MMKHRRNDECSGLARDFE